MWLIKVKSVFDAERGKTATKHSNVTLECIGESACMSQAESKVSSVGISVNHQPLIRVYCDVYWNDLKKLPLVYVCTAR